jgi:succinate dehydrogenase / fumarate reductase cytochrome b subunit
LLNGIRHLFWDAGLGFDLKAAYRSGWIVVIGSIALTIVAWVCGYAMKGMI